MPDRRDSADSASPERNPLGMGPRDREGSNTGSVEDTSYDAQGSDPYVTGAGEPRKQRGAEHTDRSVPADPDVPSSDEP